MPKKKAPAAKKPAGKARARKPATKRSRGGRPTSYRPEFARVAELLCTRGCTDAELADVLGVDTSTLWRWRAVNEEFCNAVVAGKSSANDRVVRSLFERACGYSYDAVKVMQYGGRPVYAPYREHCPPDPAAIRLWTMNRMGWRDKTDVDTTITLPGTPTMRPSRRRRSRARPRPPPKWPAPPFTHWLDRWEAPARAAGPGAGVPPRARDRQPCKRGDAKVSQP